MALILLFYKFLILFQSLPCLCFQLIYSCIALTFTGFPCPVVHLNRLSLCHNTRDVLFGIYTCTEDHLLKVGGTYFNANCLSHSLPYGEHITERRCFSLTCLPYLLKSI